MQVLEVKCMKTRVAVIFVVQLLWILSVKVVAIIPGFSKKLPLLKCIWPLYWPNIRGNLNRPVLQKVPFCHKCARVVKGMNACWSVELISAYLKLPLLKCIWPLYWPNIRGNLNRPVLQKVPFCHKCARVVKGMNACWSVELISAYLMASFAPCKGIRILESGKFLLVESIWYPLNFYCEILNPGLWNVKYSSWNPESP